jgi:hypothetical protein
MFTSTLSTWIKNSDEIKKKYLSGEMGSQRKKCRIAKFPEVEEALLKWFKNARDQNIPLCGTSLNSNVLSGNKRKNSPVSSAL